ncbi:MAG TPA: hypothetical protein PLE19_21315 [Planctomycetota bacterium]|nr:hypothetical protein [Planctomycetota bacterium]HRR83021.1 hypothetical protein [Planctomycetota bacterium]HRT97276.1 hypothetical protein [Planctomycetota bacterium]
MSKLEKTFSQDYAEALKAYAEAKKDNPSEPKPRKATVVVLEKSVRGKDKADALATKYREKYEAAQAKKQGKDPEEGAPKPTEGDKSKEEAGGPAPGDKRPT